MGGLQILQLFLVVCAHFSQCQPRIARFSAHPKDLILGCADFSVTRENISRTVRHMKNFLVTNL